MDGKSLHDVTERRLRSFGRVFRVERLQLTSIFFATLNTLFHPSALLPSLIQYCGGLLNVEWSLFHVSSPFTEYSSLVKLQLSRKQVGKALVLKEKKRKIDKTRGGNFEFSFNKK
jgi:hypothetical protein